MRGKINFTVIAAVILLCSVVVFADFASNGGWLQIFRESRRVEGPILAIDTLALTDSASAAAEVAVADVGSQPGDSAFVTFLTGGNADSTRYLDSITTDGTSFFLWFNPAMEDSPAVNDSIQVQWYDQQTIADTNSKTLEDMPVFSTNVFLGRINRLTNTDSNGVIYVVQTKIGDNDSSWSTIATYTFNAAGDSLEAFTDTLSSSYDLIGDQYRVLSIYVDSLWGEVRGTEINGEAWWRGIR